MVIFISTMGCSCRHGEKKVILVKNNELYCGIIQVATKIKITGRIQLTATVTAFYETVKSNRIRLFPMSTNYKGGCFFADVLIRSKPTSNPITSSILTPPPSQLSSK